jgi:hypothetical protein
VPEPGGLQLTLPSKRVKGAADTESSMHGLPMAFIAVDLLHHGDMVGEACRRAPASVTKTSAKTTAKTV